MLSAIIFILLIGLLIGFMLSNVAKSTKGTETLYFYEQAQALAHGGAEYAIMAIQGNDFTAGNCINNVDIDYLNTYDINISISYLGKGLPASCNLLANNIATKETNSTVIMDICVSLKPSIVKDNIPIRYCRRTLQKL